MIGYYPGCTLKTVASIFDRTAREVFRELGVELRELKNWNCCGTVYSLASDDVMHQLAPVRNLIRAKEEGYTELLTLCAMCYNTLKRANELVRRDPEVLSKINDFMYLEEVKYDGSVEVIHGFELLRELEDKIKEKVKNPLEGLKFAPYYGCLLLRPAEVAIDDPEDPRYLSHLVKLLGGEAIDFPYATECCGSYHTVGAKELVYQRTYEIVNLARELGADALVLSCPLCHFNLDARARELEAERSGFEHIPVFYFTELLAHAFGLSELQLKQKGTQ